MIQIASRQNSEELNPFNLTALSDSSQPSGSGPDTQVMNEETVEQRHARLKNEGDLCCPSPLACICSSIFPCVWAAGCQCVNEREEKVLLNFGRFAGVLRVPGCTCVNMFGTEVKTISTALQSSNIPNLKVLDLQGCPLLVSAVVTYEVRDSCKAALSVTAINQFVINQAEVVVKQICAVHPYESRVAGVDSLKTEADKIRSDIVMLLQKRVTAAGVFIHSFQFKELSYSPEIAAQMLIKQQAGAMLDARRVVVEGAVGIACDALESLKKRGITLPPEEQGRLTSNLLITICSEAKVTPTLHVN